MKKLYLSFLLLAVTIGAAFSQVPSAFNYQAVVRNASGEIIANKAVSFRISLLKDSDSGTVLYSETHTVSTNDFGLVNLKIGDGTKLSGNFSPTDWGEVIFTKVELDPAGGSSYSHLATTKLESVPYAFMAQTVVDDKVDDADADPGNEIQQISISGTTLQLSNGGGTVNLPTSGGGSADNWGTQTVVSDATLTGEGTTASPLGVSGDLTDDQSLTLTGAQLSISGGNSVTIPSSPWTETDSKIEYSGSKNISIDDGGGTSLVTKSANFSPTPKLKITTENRSAIDIRNESSNSTIYVRNNGAGYAATFYNKIAIADASKGMGKVLTSDSYGSASWKDPSSLWAKDGSDIYRPTGRVAIGADISGSIKFKVETDENFIAIRGQNNSPTYGTIYLKNKGGGSAIVAINDGSKSTIYASNNGSGLAAELHGDVTVSKDLKVDGEVHTHNTGSVNMLPIAYGHSTSGGSASAKSGSNVSVSKTSTGIYEVTITGETLNSSHYVAIVSHTGSSKTLGHYFSGGKLKVYTKNQDDRDASGDAKLSNTAFSFIIYKL